MKIQNLTFSIILALITLPMMSYGQNIELTNEWVFENVGGDREDEATGVVTDSEGNVYVTGWFSGTINLDPNGSTNGRLTAEDNNGVADDINTDIYVAKYNSNGGFINAVSLDYKGFNDRAQEIALSNDGSLVYVVGYARGEVGEDTDIYLASLNTSDLALQKVIQSSSPDDERGQGIAVHSNGNVYITGYYEKTVELFAGSFNPPVSPFSGNALEDGLFIFVFDKDLTQLVEGAVAQGTGDVRSQGIDTDDQGNAFVTGEFSGGLAFAGVSTRSSNGARDIFCAKYNLLSDQFDFAFSYGDSEDDRSRSLAIGNNSFYITGDFRNTVNFDPLGGGGGIRTVEEDYDFFVARYSLNGAFQNVYQVGGSNDRSFEQGYEVIARNNQVYVAGRITSTARDVGDEAFFEEVFNNDEADAFLAIFPPDISAPTFVQRYGRQNFDYAQALGITPNEQIFVAGFTDWGGRNDNTAPKDSYLARFAEENITITISDKFTSQTLESEVQGGRDASTADFDSDGDLDLVVAFKEGSAVRVYQNNEGVFADGTSLQNNLNNPRTIATADIDEANGPDIVYANDPDSGSELRWYRRQGDGNFGSPITITDDYAGSSDVYAGDLDQDGRADVVLANFITQNIIFFKNEEGELDEEKEIDETAGRPRAIEVGNLDNDEQNRPDLLVVVRDKNADEGGVDEDGILWYRNLGSGNFDPPVTIANASQVDSPRGAALADFDGDRDLDVVVVSNENGNITLIENLGNGSFNTPQNIGTTAKPFSVDATDLDGDGDIDIIVGSENDGPTLEDGRVDWFENNGSFSFTKETLVTVTKGQPNTIISDDIDNDGDQDLIVAYAEDGEFAIAATNLVFSLRNVIQANPSPVLSELSVTAGEVGEVITIYGGNFGSIIGTAQVFFGEIEAVVTGVSAEGTQLEVVIPELEADLYDIQIKLPSGNTALFENFQVGTPTEPFISQVNPIENVLVGTEVTIEGGGFGANPTVKLEDNTINGSTVNTEGTIITFTVPELAAGEYELSVTPEGGTPIIHGTKLTIIDEPEGPFITQVSPVENITVGTEITIEGGNFGANPAVTLGETVITITSVNPEGTTILFTVPEIAPGEYDLTVTPEGATPVVHNEKITIVLTPPEVISFSPKEGIVGTQVTLTGSRLENVEVLFNGIAVVPDEQSASSIVFTVPAAVEIDQSYPINIRQGEFELEVGNFKVVEVSDTIEPVISLNNFPETYEGTGDITLSAIVTDEGGSGVDDQTVQLFYKGLTDEGFVTVPLEAQGDDAYGTTIAADDLGPIFDADEVGLEFYVTASDNAGNASESERGFIYRSFPSIILQGVSPAANANTPQELDYQMIAIPLQPQPVSGAFEELGEYKTDNTGNWVLFRYNAGSQTYQKFQSDFTSFDPGVGYMFAYRDFTGQIALEGEVTNLTENSVPITLNPGYNLIGNPFLFELDWNDVIAYNENLGLINSGDVDATLLKWEKGTGWVTGETELASFKGAFVEAIGITQATTIQIPVTTNARIGSSSVKHQFDASLDSDSWYLPLSLHSENRTYNLGGVGMSTDAKLSADQFDNATPPRFLDYLEINFPHPESVIANFTRDIVPTQASFIWDFEVASSDGSPTTLSWDNTTFGNNDYQLVLLDLENLVQINLRNEKSYQFSVSGKRHFRLFYGNMSDIQEAMQPDQFLVGDPFPNPTSGQLSIPLSVPANQIASNVNVTIYNNTGQTVATMRQTLESGYHTLQWNGVDHQGLAVPDGLYIYRVQWNDDRPQTGKIIIR